jgi:DNA ligase D-like protein (predicted polymerase)
MRPDVRVERARPTKAPRRIEAPAPVEARAVPEGEEFLHEVELPGSRVHAWFDEGGAVRLEQAGRDVTARFRPIVEALEGTRLVDAILDGVIVDQIYLVFDLPRLDGNDLRRSPLEARKKALEPILAAAPSDPHLHYASHVVGNGAAYFEQACKLGARGIVSKRRTSPYGEPDAWRVIRCASRNEIAGVAISNPQRIMYPERGITKWDVARYYEEIGDWIVPHVADRPLTLVRCGAGLTTGEMREDCTFLRHGKAWGPPTLRRVKIREKTKVGEYLVADDLAGIIGLVQMDVLEIHTWNTTASQPDLANRIVFDLDPGPEVAWKTLVRAARTVRDALSDAGLACWVKTTGGAGLHVVAPVTPARWDECLAFVRKIAADLALAGRETFTTSIAKSGRSSKIYLDVLRNNRTNTSVAAYSTRARPDAAVSVPLDWDELGAKREPFDVDGVRRRVKHLRADPWAGYFACAQELPARRG